MEKCDYKCVGCHFFMTNTVYGNKVSAQEDFREAINNKDNDLIIKLVNSGSYSQAICYKEIWWVKSYLTTDRKINEETISELTKDRQDSCFFYPYHEGMGMQTAEELLKNKIDKEKTVSVEVSQPVEVEIPDPVNIKQKGNGVMVVLTIASIIVGIIGCFIAYMAYVDNHNKNIKPSLKSVSTSPIVSPRPTNK